MSTRLEAGFDASGIELLGRAQVASELFATGIGGIMDQLSDHGIDLVGTVETIMANDGSGAEVRVRTSAKLVEPHYHKLELYCRSLCAPPFSNVWLFVPGEDPREFSCLE